MSDLLCLSDLIGRPVVAGETRVGRVADLYARPGAQPPTVTAVLVRRRGAAPVRIALPDLETLQPRIELRRGATFDAAAADRDELLLSSHVLDVQIVDTRGKRLVRVGDVELAHEPDGTLVLAGVEVGLAAVVRRLGMRALARRMRVDTLAWEHVHVARGRGHKLLLDSPNSAVRRLGPEELADVVDRLTVALATEVLKARQESAA